MKELLNRILEKGIIIELNDGELQMFATTEEVDTELVAEIKSKKSEIIAYLKQQDESALENVAYQEIPVCEVQESYPITATQMGVWLASQIEAGSVAYNIPSSLTLEGVIDPFLFEKAIKAVIDRHQTLRTVFRADKNGVVRQFILKTEELNFAIEFTDLRNIQNSSEQLSEKVTQNAQQAFDLVAGPLLRVHLLQLKDNEFKLCYCMHHLISDGWSMDILSRDVMQHYQAFATGKTPQVNPLRIQYKDYAVWKSAQVDSPAYQQSKDFWCELFKEGVRNVDLPSTRKRPQLKTYQGKSIGSFISPEQTAQLREFTKNRGGSLFTGLLAVWNVLLNRYSGEDCITVGNMLTGREHPDIEDQIGFYITALALRNYVDTSLTFEKFYEQVRDTTLKAYSHQIYPNNQLMADLDIPRDTSRNSLFEIVINYHGVNNDTKALGELDYLGPVLVKFDLVFGFVEVAGGINLTIGFNTAVYDQDMVEGLLRHYKQLLKIVLEQPEVCIGTVDFLSEADKTKLLQTYNQQSISYPVFENILKQFSLQVQNNPEAESVTFAEQTLSYQDLDERTNQLAHYLLEQGVDQNAKVPIYFERSLEMIIGILAVLKCGAAYVPIDPAWPSQRLEFIFEDIDCQHILSHTELEAELEEFEDDYQLVFLDKLGEEPTIHSKDALDTTIETNQLAYIIYTSGTTGTPKGVMISHESIANYLSHQSKYFAVESTDRFISFASIAFDASVEQLFLPLTNGAKLLIPARADLLNHQRFPDLLKEHNITHLHAVPSFLRTIQFSDDLPLKRIVSAGEAFHPEVFETWQNKAKVYNKYGPTEATISTAQYLVSDTKYIDASIGKPIANMRCYIIGENNTLQPQGVIGEIAVAGPGLAQGYLNRAELTEERFVENPFVPGEMIYKTGDLGSWLPDGSLAFHGRIDHQVKIRGYRVELGEIEAALNQLYNIEQAAVLAVDDNSGSKQLVAYIVSNELADSNSIREGLMLILEEHLPEYMVPGIYIKMDEMPLNSSGKIDRKALPLPTTLVKQRDYVAPTTDIEIQLTSIWEEVLGMEKIGINDNFFELGGHSLLAIKLSFAITNTYNVNIAMDTIFKYPTIHEQAQYIDVLTLDTDENKSENEEVIYL